MQYRRMKSPKSGATIFGHVTIDRRPKDRLLAWKSFSEVKGRAAESRRCEPHRIRPISCSNIGFMNVYGRWVVMRDRILGGAI
jgi:hypothetical protein